MDTIKLCSLLAEVTYLVYVTRGRQLLRTGSAVAVTNGGHLITAAHVITGSENLETGYIDPEIRIYARLKTSHWKEYVVGLCAPKVEADYLVKPFVVDLALLVPVEESYEAAAPELFTQPLTAGIDVLMAGFPNEIRPPFDFHNKVKGLQADPAYLPDLRWLNYSSGQMMIKRGMIGHASSFHFQFTDSGLQLEGDLCHIDHVMYAGASGGPVIDANGVLVGIITDYTTLKTSVNGSDKETADKKYVDVPLSSTRAISPRTLLPLIVNTSSSTP